MRILFSPLGLSPGSLFTAIIATKPGRVIIITSTDAAKKVDYVRGEVIEVPPIR